MPHKLLVQHLSTDGVGGGVTNAIGNYADGGLGSTDFWIEAVPRPGRVLHIARMIVAITDAGAFDTNAYANAVTLTNGIDINVKDADDVVLFALTPTVVKTNGQWGIYAYDVAVHSWGTGPEELLARWTFGKHAAPEDGGLVLRDGQKLVATLNDDMSAITEHRFTVEGYTDVLY